MKYVEYVALLEQHHIENAEGELCELIHFICGIDREELLKKRLMCKAEKKDLLEVAAVSLSALDSLVARRISGEPVQYITHSASFYGLELFVDEHVLIPRFDTECLVESALDVMAGRGYCHVLDLCCGSGCIGAAIAQQCSTAQITFADFSEQALAVCQKNAELYCEDRFTIVQHDVFSDENFQDLDILVSNPPYISFSDMQQLSKEVKREPESALYGGKDGLDFYRRIAAKYIQSLKPGGFLLFEVGYDQAQQVVEICENNHFTNLVVRNDYHQIPRVVIGQKR